MRCASSFQPGDVFGNWSGPPSGRFFAPALWSDAIQQPRAHEGLGMMKLKVIGVVNQFIPMEERPNNSGYLWRHQWILWAS
jgi:hypothetical protein